MSLINKLKLNVLRELLRLFWGELSRHNIFAIFFIFIVMASDIAEKQALEINIQDLSKIS